MTLFTTIFRSRIPPPPDRYQAGSIMPEILAGLAIVAIFLVGYYTTAENRAERKSVTVTGEGIVLLSEALYNFRMNRQSWPTAMTDLTDYAPTLAAGGGRNGVGQPYEIDPPTPADDPVEPIVISTDVLTAERAEQVAREFPNTATVNGTTVEVEVPVPGHEPARNALLARDGERAMTGNLDMGGNDILIDGEALTGTTVRFLETLASLECSGTQRVRVVSGQPVCVSTGNTKTPSNPPSKKPSEPSEPSDPPSKTPSLTCPADDPRPSNLDTRAGWSCTAGLDGDGNCVKTCSSSCGTGDRPGKPRYYCSVGSGWGDTCDDCSSVYTCGGQNYSYVTDEGTCRNANCRYNCWPVK